MWGAVLAAVVLGGVPLVVALAERWWRRAGPRAPGFWQLARAVGGRCHVRWGPGQSPVVRVSLPGGAEGRVHAARSGRQGWVEARAYLPRSAGMVLRLHAPPAAPLRWRTPGLAPLAPSPWEGASAELTDPQRLDALLGDRRIAASLDAALAVGQPVELILAGRVVRLRARGAASEPAGAAVARLGPGMVDALRRLAEGLAEAPVAAREGPCGACAGAVDADPWRCPRCGALQHRGCRELTLGCVELSCSGAPDAPPGLSVDPPPAASVGPRADGGGAKAQEARDAVAVAGSGGGGVRPGV